MGFVGLIVNSITRTVRAASFYRGEYTGRNECLAQNSIFVLFFLSPLCTLWVMAQKPLLKTELKRIVFYVTGPEHEAITREAVRLGHRNAHRWAAARLRLPIQDAVKRSRK